MRTIVVLSCIALGTGSVWVSPPPYDLVITGGRVVDGTGAPWFYADLAITGDRIAAIGDWRGDGGDTHRRDRARRRARLHRHARAVRVQRPRRRPRGVKIMMGVTTEITGEGSVDRAGERPDDRGRPRRRGTTSASTQDFRRSAGTSTRLETRSRPAINLGTFVGAGGVRDYVIGRENRPATPAELEQMKRLVAQAMEEGALGLEHVAAVRARSLRDHRRDSSSWRRSRRSTAASTSRTSDRRAARIFESVDEVFRSPRGARFRPRSGT